MSYLLAIKLYETNGPLGMNESQRKIKIKTKIFLAKKAFENSFYQISIILSSGQYFDAWGLLY